METLRIVIVGAGHSGVHVAATLRSRGFAGRISIVEESVVAPYERPPLSKEVLDLSSRGEATPLRRSSFYESKNIELIAGAQAESIDRGGRRVVLQDGSSLAYDRLVIATGSIASSVRVPGSLLGGVQTLKTLDGAKSIRRYLESKSRFVVIGAGYIGLEVAAAAAKASCQVTVLEFQDRVMKRVTSATVSSFFQDLHARHGVNILLNSTIKSIEGEKDVTAVLTEDGQRFEADVVVTGVGVKPNQELAENAGIECDDGILVDLNGQTSDPNVFACGDVTRSYDRIAGKGLRLECVSNALSQAERVAVSVLGEPTPPYEVPWFWTVQHGQRLQTAGVQLPTDEIVIRGTPGSGKFSVLYLRNGALAALDTINNLGDFIPGRKLVAAEAQIDRDVAQDSTRRLTESASAETRSS